MDFLRDAHFFPHPEPKKRNRRIHPVFLPFSGCPVQCVFCAQDIQTGVAPGEGPNAIRETLARTDATLRVRRERGLPAPELAFFGGTFTALSQDAFHDCLGAAESWKGKGLVTELRCSTRPDALTHSILAELKAAGFGLVELGVQSFSDPALSLSRRGYTGEQALHGCLMVREAGLELGIQLLPGLPGLDRPAALRDAEIAASLAPTCARLYPCLVLEGTALAAWWREGGYHPWTLEGSVEHLADALRLFWRAGTPVIRMGLAEEPGLAAHVLAGPRHPNIGGMARGLALYTLVREELEALRVRTGSGGLPRLFAPRRCQGEFWGQGGGLVSAYAALGLARDRVTFWEDERLALVFDCLPL